MRELKLQLERTFKGVELINEEGSAHFILPGSFTMSHVRKTAARHGYTVSEGEADPTGIVKGKEIHLSPREAIGAHLFFKPKGKATYVIIIPTGERRVGDFLARLNAAIDAKKRRTHAARTPPLPIEKAMELNDVHRQQVIGFLSALTAKKGKKAPALD